MFHSLITRCLGVLLLTAAGLKTYGLGVDPVGRMGVFSSPALQFLVICFEVFVGFWLIPAKHDVAAWATALVTFTVFAIVSFYQGWVGQTSCGCLGIVRISPWYMFGFDITVVVLLLTARPAHSPSRNDILRGVLKVAVCLFGFVFLLGSLAWMAKARFGSLDAAVASLREERVSVRPSLVDLGDGVVGGTREASVELTNRTGEPIRIFGGTADCSCSVVGNLPVTIPPGETRSVAVMVRLPHAAGIFNRVAHLAIDDQGFKTAAVHLTGRAGASQ